MTMPWYEWRNIRNRLIVFGKAIQGVAPYRVLIEADRTKCPTGYCNFTKQEIAVNPGLLALPAKEQYQLTKAILVHEAGHRRFTAPQKLSPVVHQVANILEDERVERLMADQFAGVRWLVKRLAQALYAEAQPVDARSVSSGEVVAYFLQLRWAGRIGLPVKGSLSPPNQALWQKVEPLVYEAWQAEHSKLVDSNAEKIVAILGLKEYDVPVWVRAILDKLGPSEGERSDGDEAEGASAAGEQAKAEDAEPRPFDGDVPPNDSRVGRGAEYIELKPYIHLEDKVRPWAQELIEELSWEEKPGKPEPVERGGRLSLRQYLRDWKQPFLADEEQDKAPAWLALKVIVDHSTSLNRLSAGKTRMESVAEAVMTLHLVCLELALPHEVIVTPQNLKIADLSSGERGKALIAGLIPAKCGYEDMGLALKNHAKPMVGYPQDVKLVLCLTDGACNDAELGKQICQQLRGRVEVIGVLLDADENTRKYVLDMFGSDRMIACRSEELPKKLGNVLRAIRGV